MADQLHDSNNQIFLHYHVIAYYCTLLQYLLLHNSYHLIFCNPLLFFKDIEIDERHGQFLRLKVPTLDLGQAFASLEKSKVSPTGCVVDYTVCQNTLEQVFLKFAKMQEQVEGVEEHHVDVVTLGV